MILAVSLSLSDPTIQRMLIGTVLIGFTASVIGVFSFLRKKSLVGDAISHAILPGVALAYLFTETKSTWVLMIGALLAGWLATQLMDSLSRTTKLKSDSVVAIVLSIFFSIGLVLISWIQGNGSDSQSGLSDFLFGKIAAISSDDIALFALVASALLVLLILKYRAFYFVAFNPEYMKVRGYSLHWNDLLISTASILAIAMGIQAVGVVLMSALLIIPVASARMLTFRIIPLLMLSGAFGITGAIGGAFGSTLGENMPTGPWVIVVLFTITIVTFCMRAFRERTPRLPLTEQKEHE
jgi:manganese/zinc/iron transport system permease protein